MTTTKNITILFVDDDQNRHDLIRKVFFFSGFSVVHTTTADNAILLIQERSFDIICLDHDMGEGKNGKDVAKVVAMSAVDQSKFPMFVWIHSWNIVAAREMQSILQSAGIDLYVAFFTKESVNKMANIIKEKVEK